MHVLECFHVPGFSLDSLELQLPSDTSLSMFSLFVSFRDIRDIVIFLFVQPLLDILGSSSLVLLMVCVLGIVVLSRDMAWAVS